MSRALARLLLDTLRLTPVPDRARLAERWADPGVAAKAGAIAAWIAYEQGEQWLLRRLADSGALSCAPATLVESLQLAARTDAKAGLAVDAETADVLQLLAVKGVPCVLLKGPARRAAVALYPMADARRTADVDLLVPAVAAEGAWRLLVSAGYSPLYPFDPDRARPGESELWRFGPNPHHLRELTRPGGASVEIHVSSGRQLPADVAWERMSRDATELRWQGLTVRVPSATELLWHGLTHAKPSEQGGWVLRYWLDASAVLAAANVDWTAIEARMATKELPDPLRARMWLSAAAQLAGVTLPEAAASPRAFPLLRFIAWQLRVFARPRMGTAWREKLLDEAERTELGFSLAPLVAGRSWPIHVRRRIATLAARAAYLAWRLPPQSR